MNEWRLIVSRDAAATLRRLDRKQKERMVRAIDRLSADPTPGPRRDIRPLQGMPGIWRMRVGDWRILFSLRTNERVIEIMAIRPRGQAYRS